MSAQTRFTGFVDWVSDYRVIGWLVDTEDPARQPRIQLEADGAVIATATCDRPRDDLIGAGFASAAHGFEIRLPAPIPRDASLAIRIVGHDLCLDWLTSREESARAIPGAAQPGAAARREAALTLALHNAELAEGLQTWPRTPRPVKPPKTYSAACCCTWPCANRAYDRD